LLKGTAELDMKIRLFVTCSAAFFAAWLGVTFFREVPREAYPQLGKGSLPISAKVEKKEPLIVIEEESDEPVVTAE
jgi:hypothetical protein